MFSPCLEWKGPIHHWLFVTETTYDEHLCMCAFVWARGMYLSARAPWMAELCCGKYLANMLVFKEHVMHEPH